MMCKQHVPHRRIMTLASSEQHMVRVGGAVLFVPGVDCVRTTTSNHQSVSLIPQIGNITQEGTKQFLSWHCQEEAF